MDLDEEGRVNRMAPDAAVRYLWGKADSCVYGITGHHWGERSAHETAARIVLKALKELADSKLAPYWQAYAAGTPIAKDLGPLPDCPRCHGTGEEDNPQFRCHCRWSISPLRVKENRT